MSTSRGVGVNSAEFVDEKNCIVAKEALERAPIFEKIIAVCAKK
jgi:hypothetical protein